MRSVRAYVFRLLGLEKLFITRMDGKCLMIKRVKFKCEN